MKAKMIHRCIHVLDLGASLAFYERALGLAVQRRMGPDDGSWENVFLGNEKTDFQVELTWNRGRTEPYDNGGRDTHLAFEVDDMDAARALHEEMGCVCFVNERMGILHRGSRRLLAGNPPGRSRGVASRTLLATSRHPASPFPTILMTTGGIRARRVPPARLKRVGVFGNARVNRVGNGCTKRGNRAGNAWQLRWIRRCSALDARHQNVRPGRYHGSTVNCSGAAIGETGNGHGSAPLQTVRNAAGGKHPTRPPVA